VTASRSEAVTESKDPYALSTRSDQRHSGAIDKAFQFRTQGSFDSAGSSASRTILLRSG